MSTIPRIHLKDVPKSDLSPLCLESREERTEGVGYEVCFEGEVIGTIDASIAWRDRTLRWQDVNVEKDNKRKREDELSPDEKSLLLIGKCLSSANRETKKNYFENPFPFGSDSIEELAMVGGLKFTISCQLYNHWFDSVSPLKRMKREIREFDPSVLSTASLKEAEKMLKTLWVATHGILMKRVSH